MKAALATVVAWQSGLFLMAAFGGVNPRWAFPMLTLPIVLLLALFLRVYLSHLHPPGGERWTRYNEAKVSLRSIPRGRWGWLPRFPRTASAPAGEWEQAMREGAQGGLAALVAAALLALYVLIHFPLFC
jgi:hypothetical protein